MTAPFWILTAPCKRPPVIVAPRDARYVAAFESLNNALAFAPGQEKHVRIELVCAPNGLRSLTELRRHGLLGVCFEPDHERKERKVSFAELEPRKDAPFQGVRKRAS